MKLKEIFRFPETLLPLSIILGPSIVNDGMIDIQVHDTYFVFGGSRWGNLFFAPFFVMMVETWVLHIILRRKGRFFRAVALDSGDDHRYLVAGHYHYIGNPARKFCSSARDLP